MECLLEAYPDPDITWFQSDRSISDSPRVRMLRKNITKDSYLLTLEISNPTREDGGHYRCNALNEYGESNANIALNFQGMPRRKAVTQYSVSVFCVCETSQFQYLFPYLFQCRPATNQTLRTCVMSVCMSMAFYFCPFPYHILTVYCYRW